jgi:hypothetical protein
MTDDRKAVRRANSRRATLTAGTAEVRIIAADATTARQVLDALNRCYPTSGRATSYPTRDRTGTRIYATIDTRKDGRTDGE